jgi:hypothetical protein
MLKNIMRAVEYCPRHRGNSVSKRCAADETGNRENHVHCTKFTRGVSEMTTAAGRVDDSMKNKYAQQTVCK